MTFLYEKVIRSFLAGLILIIFLFVLSYVSVSWFAIVVDICWSGVFLNLHVSVLSLAKSVKLEKLEYCRKSFMKIEK